MPAVSAKLKKKYNKVRMFVGGRWRVFSQDRNYSFTRTEFEELSQGDRASYFKFHKDEPVIKPEDFPEEPPKEPEIEESEPIEEEPSDDSSEDKTDDESVESLSTYRTPSAYRRSRKKKSE